jgi:hypothetical protein
MAKKKKNDKDGSSSVESYLKKLQQSIEQDKLIYSRPEESEVSPAPPVRDRRPTPQQTPPPTTPPAVQKTAPPPPEPPVQQAPPAPPPESEEVGNLFRQGDILKMEDGTLAVYQGPVAGKEYDIALFLKKTGMIDPRGIVIYAYDVEKIGHLPPLYYEKLRHINLWNRDLIVYHLDRYERCKDIPFPTDPNLHSAPEKTPVPHRTPPPRQTKAPGVPTSYAEADPPPRPEQIQQKGRHITLKMGANEWKAVYWGKDDLGHLLAHQTHGDWSIMHMDLERFENSLQYGTLMSEDEIKTMDKSIMEKYSE